MNVPSWLVCLEWLEPSGAPHWYVGLIVAETPELAAERAADAVNGWGAAVLKIMNCHVAPFDSCVQMEIAKSQHRATRRPA